MSGQDGGGEYDDDVCPPTTENAMPRMWAGALQRASQDYSIHTGASVGWASHSPLYRAFETAVSGRI